MFLGLALGGVLKGATGAGAPIVVVPLLAMYFDVPAAVTLMVLPNLITNIWQGWEFRAHGISRRFTALFAGTGFVGAIVGTVILVSVPPHLLLLAVAAMVFVYVGFRLSRPDWRLAQSAADKLVAPVGFMGGVLQGMSGVSAPISITFLSAIKPSRNDFIATISMFFVVQAAVQVPLLTYFGLFTWERVLQGIGVTVMLLAFMPLGEWIAKRIPREAFDKLILVLLCCIGVKLVYDALF